MSHATDQETNLLGAIALAVGDRLAEAAGAAARHGAAAPAALVALHEFLENPTVSELAEVLALTPSGAVRLVDRLGTAGLVKREPGVDGRSVAVALTAAGQVTAREVLVAREQSLQFFLNPLTAPERATLRRLNGRMLAGLAATGASPKRTCRLCDTHRCGHDRGQCPVTEARSRLESTRGRVSEPDGN